MSRTIVLIYPRAEPDWPDEDKLLGLPLAVLTVARPLVRAGYDVRIVDENVTRRPVDQLRAMPRPLYVGFSVIGGYTIRAARRLAEVVAELWPGVPRVWGGWNPTLMTHLYEDASASRWVDVLVRGRGEAQALEIAQRLGGGRDLEGVLGVSWRDASGQLRRSPDAPLDDPSRAGPLPYDLIPDFDPYMTRDGVLNYISSYGCPHKCEFCGIPAYTRTFKPLPNEVVVDELVLARARGIREILFLDDNFFTSKTRVLELAGELEERSTGLRWHSNGRLDQVLALELDELRAVARSGCASINVGYETGDQEVADGIQKEIDVGDVYELARRFHDSGIHLSLNVMVGLPGETADSLVRTLESLHQVFALQPDMDVCWYMFMAAPGTESWRKLRESGHLSEPRSLVEHESLQSLYLEHPWYYESPPRWVFREWRRELKAVAWFFYIGWAAGIPRFRPLRPAFALLRRWCRWRFAKRRFGLPLEWWIAFQWRRVVVRARWARAALLRRHPFYGVSRWLAERRPKKSSPFELVTGVHRST